MSSKLLNVEWKVEECFSGPDCWCRIIVPVDVIVDENDDEWDYVIHSGAVSKEAAEHIVNLHNQSLKDK